MCINMALLISFSTVLALIRKADLMLPERDKAKGFWVMGEPTVSVSNYYAIIFEINNSNHIRIAKLQTLSRVH